jgi:hypothetical protein
LNDRAPLLYGAVPQEKIDEVLIWHPEFGCQFLEVVHRDNIKPDGDLALELFDVGVLAGHILLFRALSRVRRILTGLWCPIPVTMIDDQGARLNSALPRWIEHCGADWCERT